MKNKVLIFIITIIFFQPLLAENLNIQSSSISIDKISKLSIFKDNVTVVDTKGNILKTNYAEYDKKNELLKSKGKTSIQTSEGYFLTSTNITFDNIKKIIRSEEPTILNDLENNNIYLENFEYSTKNNFFKSIGNIKVIDSKNNSYNFSQIYIDEKKREIIGTDIKAYLNDENFKIYKNNKPRIFANTVQITDKKDLYNKSIFTLCDYREKDKCPPWSLQASQMIHDKVKKTIYYDNAVVKIYDFPLFYLPKLSHPDPSIDRRSGFLPPVLSNSKNLGTGIEIPYFWALDNEKDLTFKNKLFVSENPLLMAEYRHAFKNSNLIADFGYTEGYKKKSKKKKSGDKSHFFSKYVKKFTTKNNNENNLSITLQNVSNDKYLKLYKINSDLVNYETNTLENSLQFSHEQDDLFLGINASIYENLRDTYNDKYEYVLPDLVVDKNLFSSVQYGYADLKSNLNIHNYDTNKISKFLINDIDWKSRNFDYKSGFSGKFLAKLRNVNYEANNISYYKKNPSNELFGAFGFLSKIDLFKKTNNNISQFLTPKMLFRYAPDHMRKQEIDEGTRIDANSVFDLDRLNSFNNFESGLSASFGFDYKMTNYEKQLDVHVGQIVNNDENKNMPSSSSLDEKISDLVANTTLTLNKNEKLNYDFKLDKNYNDINYNEVGADLTYNYVNFDINFLQEKKHIGNKEYLKTNLEIAKGNNGLFTFGTKRNLVSNSAEYYNLSYEYLNDCLRAGIVYRREFYDDSELESENSLMFKITLTPFGDIETPSLSQ